ncbi:MAG: hypothetical protein GF416_01705 [Candidatus Altiarchaeales archaeon]|nr:hypothetical protein [Candidatus Altiarchaeales archaeon]MBD3415831.1 hypothetical protein [Candidatus Altiarchaeales archaeon]
MDKLRKEVIVVSKEEELSGFRLAGVSEVIDYRDDGLVERLMGKEAIILISHEALEKIGGKVAQLREKSIVQEMPGEGEYTRLNEIIKNTVGFELKS